MQAAPNAGVLPRLSDEKCCPCSIWPRTSLCSRWKLRFRDSVRSARDGGRSRAARNPREDEIRSAKYSKLPALRGAVMNSKLLPPLKLARFFRAQSNEFRTAQLGPPVGVLKRFPLPRQDLQRRGARRRKQNSRRPAPFPERYANLARVLDSRSKNTRPKPTQEPTRRLRLSASPCPPLTTTSTCS